MDEEQKEQSGGWVGRGLMKEGGAAIILGFFF